MSKLRKQKAVDRAQTALFAVGVPEGHRVKVLMNRPPFDPAYRPPTHFPNFRDAKRVTIDFETYDPELTTKGCGLMRNNAYVVGTAIQIESKSGDKYVEYYPQRHNYGDNCNAEGVEKWLADNMNNGAFKGEICGANVCQYDGMFMHEKGIRPTEAKWRDIQWAEPLLDDNAMKYSLDTLCAKYGMPGKDKALLNSMYGEKIWIKNFADVHPAHARGYVLGDVDRPGRILDLQYKKLEAEGLMSLYDLESRLTPFLHYMRKVGVRVNKQAAENFNDELALMRDNKFEDLSEQVGFPVEYENYGKPKTLIQIFDALGIQYPYTAPTAKHPNGQPSFKKEWLDTLTSPSVRHLQGARSFEKSRSTFVEGYILDYIVGDRVHCEFNPLRQIDDEEGKRGAASGRFSSCNPNLQNIPSRDPFLGPILRAMFLPEPGAQWWSLDYSQIEYRLLIHFAFLSKCIGADVARNMYLNDPATDFHVMSAKLMEEPLLKLLTNSIWKGIVPEDWAKQIRKIAKNINFGLAYGMGADKLARSLGLAYWDKNLKMWKATPEAIEILNTYHERNPYVKAVNKKASAYAQRLGYIKTILGRRSRFETWEPDSFGTGRQPAYDLKTAQSIYAPDGAEWCIDEKTGRCVADWTEKGQRHTMKLRRALTHKALNRVLQGSAADMMKLAMARIWEAGIFDLNASNDIWCHLTVHDELDGSVLPTERGKKALAEVKHIMATCMPLKVPVMASGELGANWFEAH